MSRQAMRKGKPTAPDRADLRRTHGSPLLKTFAAEYGTSLCRAKRNGGFLPALRTTGLGLRTHRAAVRAAARRLRALGLAGLAAFGRVLKALIGEKHLVAGRKYKLSATLRAFQNLVMVFHGSGPPLRPQPERERAESCANG